MRSSASRKLQAEDQLDRVFHALADRTRRDLLRQLAKGPARVTDLAAPYAMSLPAVSKHLRVLEAAALIERAVNGRVHRIAVAPEALNDVERWVAHYRGFWNDKLEALAKFVEK